MIATMQQITVECSETPPQVFLSNMRQFVHGNPDTPPRYISLQWKVAKETLSAREDSKVPTEQSKRMLHDCVQKTTVFFLAYIHPWRYKKSPWCPVLRGEGHC